MMSSIIIRVIANYKSQVSLFVKSDIWAGEIVGD